MDPVIRVRDALARGELSLEGLTARKLGAFLGKTTSVLYHHYGSLDRFLFEVGQAGFVQLKEQLTQCHQDGGMLADVATSFVAFGLDRPALYHLMLERRYDWAALREAGTFDSPVAGNTIWGTLVSALRQAGAEDPVLDTRLLVAGLHGLVSLALSGRANVGALTVSDRDMALTAARGLAERLCPTRDHHNCDNNDQRPRK